MARRKRIVFLAGIVVIAAATLALFYFRKTPLIPSLYTMSPDGAIRSETDIAVIQVSFDGVDVTDVMDKVAVASLFNRFSCRRSLTWVSPYSIQDAWEITLVVGGRPRHIVLTEGGVSGTRYVRYESINSGVYEILNGKSLRSALGAMLDESGGS